mmetsp:Transcript_70987/g.152974  ORF Transcript_70987/g.152974 Transcript_70987/m.152974 type:complete len:99 (+) Transcript_70987:384-680(+)
MFNKTEKVVDPGLLELHLNRGSTGPTCVSMSPSTPLQQRFIKSAIDCGFKKQDFNSKYDDKVVFEGQYNILNGVRQNSFKAYLEKNTSRKNLSILTNS